MSKQSESWILISARVLIVQSKRGSKQWWDLGNATRTLALALREGAVAFRVVAKHRDRARVRAGGNFREFCQKSVSIVWSNREVRFWKCNTYLSRSRRRLKRRPYRNRTRRRLDR